MPGFLILQLAGNPPKRIRVGKNSPWKLVRDFFNGRFPGCQVVFRDSEGDWCTIEDERSWRDAVRQCTAMMAAAKSKIPVLDIHIRSPRFDAKALKRMGERKNYHPRVLDRPDGPWPTIKGKLPPVVNDTSEDWVDIVTEVKSLKTSSRAATCVTLTVNGVNHMVSNVDPTMKLANFLRDVLHLTGTKIGCGEGGCGACTVQVEFPDGSKGILNSCMRPLASLNNAKVTTVEGIGSTRTGLHPAQEKLATCNGSQCGFCSPGMVMAMYGMLGRTDSKPNLEDTEDSFQGNICRCTGYRPILAAAHTFASQNPNLDQKKKPKGDKKMKKHGAPDGKKHYLAPVHTDHVWYNPGSVDEAAKTYSELVSAGTPVRLVTGNTSIGVVKYYAPHPNDEPKAFVHIGHLADLRTITHGGGGVMVFGSAVTLTRMRAALLASNTQRGAALARHIHLVANHQVRNAGCWTGNLEMARTHHDFPSDVILLLIASGATLQAIDAASGQAVAMPVADYLAIDPSKPQPLVLSCTIDLSDDKGFLTTHKVMARHVNTHAYVNAAFSLEVKAGVISACTLAIGALQLGPFLCPNTAKAMIGQTLNGDTLRAALAALKAELPADQFEYKSRSSLKKKKKPSADPAPSPALEAPRAYRHSLALTLFYKSYLAAIAHFSASSAALPARLRSAATPYKRPVSKGKQAFSSDSALAPVNEPVMKLSAPLQTSGEAKYTCDLTSPSRCMHAYPVLSTQPRATIDSIDVTKAMQVTGVVKVITAKDIQNLGGSNNCGVFPGDEPIFAEKEVECVGQYVALVVATDEKTAEDAAKLVVVNYSAPSSPAVLGIDDAIKQKSFLQPNEYSKQFNPVVERGDVDKAWSTCDYVVSGDVNTSGQCHFYMETQNVIAEVDEGGRLDIQVASQGPMAVRKQVAVAVNKGSHKVVCGSRRVGGAFGGKLARNMPLATACAVAAETLGVSVRAQLSRQTDMSTCGSRHPYLARYKIGFNKDGHIIALTIDVFADAGYTFDDSLGLLDMLQTMMDNAYFIPNYRTTSTACKTNVITNTDMRSPGVCSGVFFMENVLDIVATSLNLPAQTVRETNFYAQDGKQTTPCGDPLTYITLQHVWSTLKDNSQFVARKAAVEAFNKANRWRKRGIYLTPSKYGISQRFYTQAVTVNICSEDGSIAIAHTGVEIGQGINTKVAQAVCYKLGVPLSLVEITHNSTAILPNASLTGGSGTSETVVNAALRAAEDMLAKLQPYMNAKSNWADAVAAAYGAGVNLSSQGYFGGCQGVNPMYDYFVYAACCSEVELDVLTGEIQVVRSDIVYDCGKSLNQAVDVGQVEGAFIQSLGFYFTEAVVHSEDTGKVMTAGTWDYRPPTAMDIPQEFNVTFIKTENPAKINTLGSKAVGEPPYQLGASAFFAAKQAVYAARADAGLSGYVHLNTPATPVDLQQACGVSPEQLTLSG